MRSPAMNGGQTDERRITNAIRPSGNTHGIPMRPGDVIDTRSRLLDWWEHEGRLGHTLYVRSEICA